MCKLSSNSIQNCDSRSDDRTHTQRETDRQTDTDASDPMLCYSNGTDKFLCLVTVLVDHHASARRDPTLLLRVLAVLGLYMYATSSHFVIIIALYIDTSPAKVDSVEIIEKNQFMTLSTAIVHCVTHRKQQK